MAKSKAILNAVKAASGASSAEILSTKLVTTRRSTSSRALLATTVEAEIAVGVDTAEAAQAAAVGLSAENLNEALAAVGVPAATVLVAPTIDAASGEAVPAPGVVFFVRMAARSKLHLAYFSDAVVRTLRAAASRAAVVDVERVRVTVSVILGVHSLAGAGRAGGAGGAGGAGARGGQRRVAGDSRIDVRATLLSEADAQSAALMLTVDR